MLQPQIDKSLSPIAQQVLWKYWGEAANTVENEFYAAMRDIVGEELRKRLKTGTVIHVGREIRLRIGQYSIHARVTNIEPLLATTVDSSTVFLTEYREYGKDAGTDISAFIVEILRYPFIDSSMEQMYTSLVGIKHIKRDMLRKLHLLLGPDILEDWFKHSYPNNPPTQLTQALRSRYPLLLLEGEVGAGKTALARSIGQPLSVLMRSDIALFVVNAQVRGGGHVGELTQNISRAFDEAERFQERERIPVMLLIDEADALAQSRGGNQTHHEDDAGVNTLIQRIDRLRGRPIAVIFSTNLVQSLDAAIIRRATASYHFDRPNDEQRGELFHRLLVPSILDEQALPELVTATSPRRLPNSTYAHRYTYSDISQRIIPRAVENAIYAQQLLHISHFTAACEATTPTPEMVIRTI